MGDKIDGNVNVVADEPTIVTPEPQRTFFSTPFLVLVGIILFNFIFAILASVFNFYNFDYTQFYSVIIYYLFLLSCGLFLPTKMPGEIVGTENLRSHLSQLITRAIPMNETSIQTAEPIVSTTQSDSQI